MIAELEPSSAPATGVQIRRVNLGDLHPSPTNPRKHFDAESLAELASSIEEHGVKMPLLGRASKTEPGKIEIIAGERRYRANSLLVKSLIERIELADEETAARLTALHAQRLDAPVIVEDLDDATVLELQLIENLQRQDLTPLEEARGYEALLKLPGYTPAKIAQKTGKGIRTVLHKLQMLNAPKVLQDALERGEVGERHLVLVAAIPGKAAREACAKEVIEGDWDYEEEGKKPLSVRETLSLINEDYRVSLKRCGWDLEDAEMVKDAGACVSCPHFAQFAATQDRELAEQLGNERGKTDPLTCLNPGCYKKKQEALWKRKQAEAKDGDVTVLPEKTMIINDYGSLPHNSAYVKLDDRPGYDETGHYDNETLPTWRELVEDRLPKGAVNVAKTGAGVFELVKKADVVEAARQHAEHGKVFAKLKIKDNGRKELTAAEKRAKEKQLFEKKVEGRMRTTLLQHLYECALTKGMNAEAGLAVLDAALHEAGMDGNRLICDWLSLEPTATKKDRDLSQDNYREAILKSLRDRDAGKPEIDAMVMIAVVSKWVKVYGLHVSSLEPLQEHFGFDKKTITALATAEVRAALEAKAAKKKPEKAGKAAKNSTDPVDFSVDKEVSKTAAADEIAKQREPAPKTKAGRAQMVKDLGEMLDEWRGILPSKIGKATGWTPEDVEAGAELLKAKTHDVTTLIGPKPDRKKDGIAYKNWNGLRMKLLRKAGLAK